MTEITISLQEIQQTTSKALQAHGALPWIADSVAHAVSIAEGYNNKICGLYYLPSYCQQLASGRVNGTVEPIISQPKSATVAVNAGFGFAQPAFQRGLPLALETATNNGIACLAICHAHTCTSLGYFTQQIGEAGFIAIGLTNASACVSPPGGNEALLGTNPIAMSVPAEKGGLSMHFDQSTSAIALGKITMAAAAGEPIPLGWGVDADGNPTTDPQAVINGGTLVSAGGYKGYGFGLMAEVLASALTGGNTSTQLEPLKKPAGAPHDLGQTYIILDPTHIAGSDFWQKIAAITAVVDKQPKARLPGAQRKLPDNANIETTIWQQVLALANSATS